MRRYVTAAKRFFEAIPWSRWPDKCIVGFDLPDEQHPVFVSVLGYGGQNCGLGCFTGPNAEAAILQLLDRDADHDPTRFDFLNLRFVAMGSLLPAERRSMQAAGWTKSLAPDLIVGIAGREHRVGRRREQVTLTYILNAWLQAEADGLADAFATCEFAEMPLVRVFGKPQDPVIEITRHEVGPEFRALAASHHAWPGGSHGDSDPTGEPVEKLPLFSSDEYVAELPRTGQRWGASLNPMPATARGARPAVSHSLIVADLDDEIVLSGGPVARFDWGEITSIVESAFLAPAMEREPCIPREIVFSSTALAKAYRDALEELGISCVVDEHDATLTELNERLNAILSGEAPELTPPEELPDADDLEGWKRADLSLTDELIERTPGTSAKLLDRFFGDARIYDRLLEEERPGAQTSYAEWRLFVYRKKANQQTFAERMKRQDIPECWQVLLERRANAVPTLARIEAIVKGVSLDIVDIFTGRRWTIHDRAMSKSAEIDVVLGLRVYPVGEFHFVTLAAPALSPLVADKAISILEKARFDPAKDPRTATRLLGQLWALQARPSRGLPRLVTREGDHLCFQKASFRTLDPEQAVRALDARQDLERDEDAWTCYQEEDAGQSIRSLCGRLTIEEDEILVETLSRAQLDRIRSWLEEVPGITHLRTVETDPRPLDPNLKRPSPSDDGSLELSEFPPAARDQIREHLRQLNLRWLDEQIPALDGKTPREAASSEAGRARIAAMIRSMPRPRGLGGDFDVPREEMLRELGIDQS